MALRDSIQKVFYMDELIRAESTGNIKELSVKLNVTERHVYNYLKIFNEIGRHNYFDTQKNSYVYDADTSWGV